MNKWELARYLIDAKKCVDNVLFIAANAKELRNLSLRDIVEDRQRKFYINVKIVYDKCISKANQKTLKTTDNIYEETCKERDKNYAHKDDDYVQPDHDSILEIADIMKERLQHCFDLCKDSLPDVLTLDFIDYDRDLYRFLNKIDPEKEELLLKLQHLLYGVKPTDEDLKDSVVKKVFCDTEDIKKISNPDDYGVIMKSGLTVREGIQERQDACIKINVLANLNMLAETNMEAIKKMKKMIEECPNSPFLY